jgi:hypothetical protein
MQNLRHGLDDRGMRNLRQGLDRGMQNLRQERDRGIQNLRQRRDRGMQNLRQGCDRGMETLRQARDEGQAITRFMYNAIVHPMEQIPWKDIIAISVVAVLCCLHFISQLRGPNYDFKDIKCK